MDREEKKLSLVMCMLRVENGCNENRNVHVAWRQVWVAGEVL